MAAPATPQDIRDANLRYHDAAARGYDAKWSIDFGPNGREQVLGKLRKALGGRAGPFAHALEVGAGTGYFTLNLLAAGVLERATCSDLSPGMLAQLRRNADALGLRVATATADAEALPFADAGFDLVLGHAVLHHIPRLERGFAEFHRVLAPGGTLVFAGEPSRHGDRLAAIPKRAAALAAPAWRAMLGAGRAPATSNGNAPDDGDALQSRIDVHAFTPGRLAALARGAGFAEIRVRGEELLANWFGWTSRTLEASADPDLVPWAWKVFAQRGYLFLQELDRRLLEPRLPPAAFYNLMLSATKPF